MTPLPGLPGGKPYVSLAELEATVEAHAKAAMPSLSLMIRMADSQRYGLPAPTA